MLGGTARCDFEPDSGRPLLVHQQRGRYGGDDLRALAEQTGASSVAVFLDDPARFLRPYAKRQRRRGGPEPLPRPDQVERWCDWLPGSPGAAYLARRGIPLEVAQAARVGWDGRVLRLPMFNRGEIVAAKRRAPRNGAKMIALAGTGRPWPMYPEPEPEWWSVLVVAGELDALRGRAAGLPACSVTLGAGTWLDAWTDQLRGRRVVVAFDNGEEEQARAAVRKLLAAGVRARRLDLHDLGLTDEKGDLSDYLDRGGDSAARVRRAMRPRIVRRSVSWR